MPPKLCFIVKIRNRDFSQLQVVLVIFGELAFSKPNPYEGRMNEELVNKQRITGEQKRDYRHILDSIITGTIGNRGSNGRNPLTDSFKGNQNSIRLCILRI